jgi:hypothetical protein
MKENNWINHIEMLVIFLTLIGGFYSIDAKFDAKFDASSSRMDQFIFAWHEESKDFHTKLALQDQEFKLHMMHQHSKEK